MTLAELVFDTVDRTVIARILGEIDMSNADELKSGILGRVSNDQAGVVLDLGELTYLDSAGIRMMFEIREMLVTRGLALQVVISRGGQVDSTLELVGASDALGVTTSVDAAVERLAGT